MFVRAAGGDPAKIGYESISIEELHRRVMSERMRLDSDELSYMKSMLFDNNEPRVSHVTGIHILPGEKRPGELMPEHVRNKIVEIIQKYTDGKFSLVNGEWLLSEH